MVTYAWSRASGRRAGWYKLNSVAMREDGTAAFWQFNDATISEDSDLDSDSNLSVMRELEVNFKTLIFENV
jgi:hypothetical protein